jgi:hypothetical protein
MMPYGPPSPIRFDGIVFFNDVREHETATRGSLFVGELDLFDKGWQARKMVGASIGSWRTVRSPAEARAFITSRMLR